MTDEEILRAKTNTWAEGILNQDAACVDSLLAPVFYAALAVRGSQTATVSRNQFLHNVANYQLESLTIDDLQVRIFGDVAVVTFLWTQRAEWYGERRDGQFYNTDIWTRQNGDWLLASHHSSRPDPGPLPRGMSES